jgi:hypothetical protein
VQWMKLLRKILGTEEKRTKVLTPTPLFSTCRFFWRKRAPQTDRGICPNGTFLWSVIWGLTEKVTSKSGQERGPCLEARPKVQGGVFVDGLFCGRVV